MLSFFTSGIILGLAAGFFPGPLLTLLVSETLRHDSRAGIRVALAPLLTDLPIIALTLFVLARLAGFQVILGAISMLGAGFVFYLGLGGLRTEAVKLAQKANPPQSLKKGIIVNLLSPHPYLFWFTVGAPIAVKASGHGFLAPLAFVGSFYAMLVGAKVFLAIAVGRSRAFLAGKAYLYTIRGLGLLLLVFAGLLFRDGLKLTGLLL